MEFTDLRGSTTGRQAHEEWVSTLNVASQIRQISTRRLDAPGHHGETGPGLSQRWPCPAPSPNLRRTARLVARESSIGGLTSGSHIRESVR